MYRTLDPSTEQILELFSLSSEQEIEAALDLSTRSFVKWRTTPLEGRTDALFAIANSLHAQADALAIVMATEMGKPIAEGVAEAKKCAWACRYYAEHAVEILASEALQSDGSAAYVRRDPLGPILLVMPWNFPLWQVFRCVAPALAAGNTLILKHAPNTPRCALAMQTLLNQHLEKGVFQNLFLDNEQAGRVIADPRVRGVSLTGSTRAGMEIASQAGRALKPVVLELGGSDPFIVFEDADLQRAVEIGTLSRCLNSGQSCIAAKRFLVAKSIYSEFLERLTESMVNLSIGDPRQGYRMGPLARKDLADQLANQVQLAKHSGACVVGSTKHVPDVGFFHAAMVLAGHDPFSEPAQDEFFGPVAQVFPFTDESNALEIANATPFGLGASVWTQDTQRIERMVEKLDVGSVFVNGLVKSDPRLPFGGTKQSGYGRELASEGLLEFMNLKTVWMA